ncbi:MAG: DUF5602 domain-containing protein [Gemmatimonadota bacterium]|nr:DUF5602 domain-containing protein [Gemmatimonadota bacterium]
MTRSRALAAVVIPASVILGMFACSDGTSPGRTVFGTPLTMGNGTARTYVELSSDGEPLSIGVSLSETALAGLPATGTEFALPLPSEVSVAPYDHAVVNWGPTGHPPAGVFTVPHFDVHFYMITQAERAAIVPTDPQFAAKTARTPAAEFIPAGYNRDAIAIPRMGVHWSDPSAPEFSGQAFTKTFIYGSWDGAFHFTEPMVTKAFLETKPAMAVSTLKLPARYSKPGYQPASYTIGYDQAAKEYRIAISGLVRRQ